MSDLGIGLSFNPMDLLTFPYTIQQNKLNRDFAKSESARSQANWNAEFGFANKQFEYMQQQNDLTRSREDTAVQRRMADLRAAGIHPVMAAGAAADASGVSTAGNVGRASPVANAQIDQIRSEITADILSKSQVQLNSALASKALSEGREADANADAIPGRLALDKDALVKQVEQWSASNGINNVLASAATKDAATRAAAQKVEQGIYDFSVKIREEKWRLERQGMISEQAVNSALYRKYSTELAKLSAEISLLAKDLSNYTAREIRAWVDALIPDISIRFSPDAVGGQGSATRPMTDSQWRSWGNLSK